MRAHRRRVLGMVAAVTTALGALVGAGGGAGAAEVSGFSVSPSTVAFGDQTVGTTSAPQTVTVDVPAGWELADFGVTGSEGGDFDAEDAAFQACAVTPGPTQCSIPVTFTPGGTGSRSAKATLDISPTPNGGGGGPSKTITLKGKGLAPSVGDPDFSVSPTTFDYGNVPVKAHSTAIFTLDVPAGFQLTGAGVGGGDDEDFAIDDASFDACLRQPGPRQCSIGVVFTPDGTGPRSTTADFAAGPVGGGDDVNVFTQLSGTGIAEAAAPEPGGPWIPSTPLTPAPAAPAEPLARVPRFTG